MANANASRRCRHCSRSYPASNDYSNCPVHGTPTIFDATRPPDEYEDDAIRVLRVPVSESDGRYWISSHDLNAAGIHDRLATDEIVQVPNARPPERDHPGDDLYEVVGYVDSTRSYWIEPIRVDSLIARILLHD